MRQRHSEHPFTVIKPVRRAEAGTHEQVAQAAFGELVAVLGVDGLAFRKRKTLAREMYALRHEALEVHFDARSSGIPAHLVPKTSQLEIRSQFTVQAGEHVKIELRGHPCGIVVSPQQLINGLAAAGREIDSQQHGVPGLVQVRPQFAKNR